MSQPAVLLDTDILSELLKQHPLVVQRVRNYLVKHERWPSRSSRAMNSCED